MPAKRAKYSAAHRAHFGHKPAIYKVYRNTPYGRLRWHLAHRTAINIRQRGIPCPELLFSGWDRQWRAYVLVCEYLEGNTLRWLRSEADETRQAPALKQITGLLALMHSRGVVQHDTNFGNFLDTGGQILALDEDRMSCLPWQPGRRKSFRNLASLLSRIPAQSAPLETQLYDHYRRARGWPAAPEDQGYLIALTRYLRTRRQNRKRAA